MPEIGTPDHYSTSRCNYELYEGSREQENNVRKKPITSGMHNIHIHNLFVHVYYSSICALLTHTFESK